MTLESLLASERTTSTVGHSASRASQSALALLGPATYDDEEITQAVLGAVLMADFSPYQKKIIERYYRNFDAIKHQQLSELVTELYLVEGKKSDRLWKRVEESLRKLEFPESRISHLMEKREPSMLVGILAELEQRSTGRR